MSQTLYLKNYNHLHEHYSNTGLIPCNVTRFGAVLNVCHDLLLTTYAFGKRVNSEHHLEKYECFFLTFAVPILQPSISGRIVDVGELWKYFCESDDQFAVNYIVYHHFTAKCWVVRDSEKFACDFVLYKKGPEYYHSTYMVVINDLLSEKKLQWSYFMSLTRIAEAANKKILIAEISSTQPTMTHRQLIDDFTSIKYMRVNEISLKRGLPT